MLSNVLEQFVWLIGGTDIPTGVGIWQLTFRTIVVFAAALLLIRLGKRRFMGGYTAFDILLGFLVGSIMSRTITGTLRLFDMIWIIAILMTLHWLISSATFYFERFSGVVKTGTRKLIIDGVVQEDAMKRSKLGENDLLQAVRKKVSVESFDEVKSAYLERDGTITVIPKQCEPQIVEIKVEDGVQKVRISIHS